ncbi:EscU/YscU/HrcU family type III secretion system export apparatus switch protein [Cryptosporangium phraense]|uniref:EscU/YscU/HrcU family type III secretion system export apparatus switch protein n=1 Tax=Cryptosporangium phraense TaxID=2593070 RepID=A0A545AG04_9ACTN|nr:EscU/YscU/HrcU family type III secretion system export apparatus switch protein [Cryptosporangium phraense]TQS39565.1 EscU/YscU/HrcU family type III secretion system export apparatus switch protein [Cryptosporangium phraense]
MSGEKTEKPTPQKKKQARKEGQIARTPDLGAWVGMLLASMILPIVIRNMMERVRTLLDKAVDLIEHPDPNRGMGLMHDVLMTVLITVAPLALSMLLAGVGAATAQGGMNFATKLLKPKFSKLNPFSGLKKILGPHALWEGIKTIVKSSVLGLVLYYSIKDLIPVLMGGGQIPTEVIISEVVDTVERLIRSAAAAGLVMAAADYAVAKRRIDKQLRMSKQDIKEEHKKTEGDPHIKGAIRARQMAMSRNRMMSDVPKADVIVTNPTHVAVALRYDPLKGAPRVVAKGSGTIADKIRTLGTENRVPMIQDVGLARTLYKACQIGQEIPPELYAAVATVLAFVMSLKAKGAAAGTHKLPPNRRAGLPGDADVP